MDKQAKLLKEIYNIAMQDITLEELSQKATQLLLSVYPSASRLLQRMIGDYGRSLKELYYSEKDFFKQFRKEIKK